MRRTFLFFVFVCLCALSVAQERPMVRTGILFEGRTALDTLAWPSRMPSCSDSLVFDVQLNRYGDVSTIELESPDKHVDFDGDILKEIMGGILRFRFAESASSPVFQWGKIYYVFEVPCVEEEIPESSEEETVLQADESAVVLEPVAVEQEIVPELPPVLEHLHFRGIPIDGTAEEFAGKMVEAGFRNIGTRNGVVFFRGPFAGSDEVDLYAFGSGAGVYKLTVEMPPQDSWVAMKKQYFFFKKSFSTKYFCTPVSQEVFPSYNQEGSGREHNAFREEAAEYRSDFFVPNGRIVISVQYSARAGRLFLRIDYIDDINSRAFEESIMKDI